jgi:hypothetical protein
MLLRAIAAEASLLVSPLITAAIVVTTTITISDNTAAVLITDSADLLLIHDSCSTCTDSSQMAGMSSCALNSFSASGSSEISTFVLIEVAVFVVVVVLPVEFGSDIFK